MDNRIEQKFQSLTYLIGNTPLLDIRFMFAGQERRIFAKAEHMNMTGSIKDRMALHILRQAYLAGRLQPGQTIIEATSGNTGISFSAIGRALGHPVTIFMPDWMSRERVDLISSMGATIRPVSRQEGGFIGSIEMAEALSKNNGGGFLPSQFSNVDNVSAHSSSTGPELWWQLEFSDLKLNAFVAGVGTGGTIMGVGSYLRSRNELIKIYAMEPANSPTLRTGCKVGKHRIQGISDEFIPAIMDMSSLDGIIDVDDGDAIVMSQKLADQLGLAVGISSGANFLAALKVQEEIGAAAIVATVFPDDNKKYLSTDLLRKEPVKSDFMSSEVELLDFQVHRRVCKTCCEDHSCTRKISSEEGIRC